MKISMFEKFLESVRPYKKLKEQYEFIKTVKECGIWTALDAARKSGHIPTNTAFIILRFGVFDYYSDIPTKDVNLERFLELYEAFVPKYEDALDKIFSEVRTSKVITLWNDYADEYDDAYIYQTDNEDDMKELLATLPVEEDRIKKHKYVIMQNGMANATDDVSKIINLKILKKYFMLY